MGRSDCRDKATAFRVSGGRAFPRGAADGDRVRIEPRLFLEAGQALIGPTDSRIADPEIRVSKGRTSGFVQARLCIGRHAIQHQEYY